MHSKEELALLPADNAHSVRLNTEKGNLSKLFGKPFSYCGPRGCQSNQCCCYFCLQNAGCSIIGCSFTDRCAPSNCSTALLST